MLTWRTYRGAVIDMGAIDDEDARFLERCYGEWRSGASWARMLDLTRGPDNPALRATHGVITDEVWHRPVFRALSDLEDRCGLRDGGLRNDQGWDVTTDPLADTWLPASQVAATLGVTLGGLHGAIRRGELVARPATPGGKRIVVSMNSAAHWRPNHARQQAGRSGGTRPSRVT